MCSSVESFLLDNSSSEVPDVAKPVEIVDKRSGDMYLFILSSFMCPWFIKNILLYFQSNKQHPSYNFPFIINLATAFHFNL